jgi:hypothetical protein
MYNIYSMEKWQYKTLYKDPTVFKKKDEALDKMINLEGLQGWELVSVVSPSLWGTSGNLILFFKKRIE